MPIYTQGEDVYPSQDKVKTESHGLKRFVKRYYLSWKNKVNALSWVAHWIKLMTYFAYRVLIDMWFVHYELLNLADKSELIEAVIKRTPKLRHLFINDDVFYKAFITKISHSHPVAGSVRTAAEAYMIDMIKAHGYKPYNVSRCQGYKGDGTRLFYSQKDLGIKFSNDKITKDHVLVMTDVDYYTDINYWLKYNIPILLYTFSPSQVVKREGDFAYRCKQGNEIEFSVAGGSSYQHKIWDYTGDTVSVYDDDWNLNVFNIEQRNIPNDPEHKFIYIIPMAQVPYPECMYMEEEQPLKRKKFVSKTGFVWFYDSLTDFLSIGKVGAWNSVETTGRIFNALKIRMESKTTPPLVSDVERMLAASGDKDAAISAPFLYEALALDKIKPNLTTTNGTVAYLPIGSLATEDGKDTMKATTTQLVTEGAVAPMKSLATDEATIKGRIEKVKNDKTPGKQIKELADEFISMIVPEGDVGIPYSAEQVRNSQSKSQQKARFDMVKDTLTTMAKNKIKCFVKSEAYNSVNDPRNISTMSPEITIMLSSFTLAFKDMLLKHKVSWYGPGLSPKQTIERLRSLGSNFPDWLIIDYSRLDGSVSKWLQQQIVCAAYSKWCKAEYRVELTHLLREVFKQNAISSNGKKFNIGWGTRSGSPQTTDGNTMICGFVLYSALRKLGYNKDEAWSKMGLVYGDDGATPAVEGLHESILQVSNELGLKIKTEIIPNGEPVPYLGRIFVDPSTSNDSFQDPMRTIPKLHLTTQKNLSTEQAATNKAFGYRCTDANTPIIGTWANKVIEITGLQAKGLDNETKHKMSNSWPLSDKERLFAPVAKCLHISEAELRSLDAELTKVEALDQFPVLFNTEREIKIPAVVDGLVVEPLHSISQNDDKQANSGIELQPMEGESTKVDRDISVRPRSTPSDASPKSSNTRNENWRGRRVKTGNRTGDANINSRTTNLNPRAKPFFPRREGGNRTRATHDLSLPKGETGHLHKCVKCNQTYLHFHRFVHANHKQFAYQCPNNNCDWFYGKQTGAQQAN